MADTLIVAEYAPLTHVRPSVGSALIGLEAINAEAAVSNVARVAV